MYSPFAPADERVLGVLCVGDEGRRLTRSLVDRCVHEYTPMRFDVRAQRSGIVGDGGGEDKEVTDHE
jgi:hypothetical protein